MKFKAAVTAAILAIAVMVNPAPAQAASLTMLGGDVSSLQRTLDLGGKYYNASGTAANPYDILKTAGMNYARLRVWNNPASGYNNKAKVLQQAAAIKAKGLKLMVDFHYSDTWADPGKQYPPAAWKSYSLSQLQTAVYNYTYDVCTSLKSAGLTPDSVQIGNEINVGMLWPQGQVVNNNFAPLASLLKQGYNATKACNSGTQVLIHVADADSMANARWFFDGIKAQGVQWDVSALSYYCMWHGTLANLYNVITDVRTRYGKPVVIAETAYQFTTADADSEKNSIPGTVLCDGIPATSAGQAQQFTWTQNTARNAGAIGVFYWEPTWYAIKGNGWDPANINGTGDGWDNMAVFDWGGKVNPYIKWSA
ncbi:MAG TPA: glycosyl hydrolase 53 family protein [Actinoplanes sp.]|nr:glycosyl hydrolase 53 family protein [Actinoplanes sp.]